MFGISQILHTGRTSVQYVFEWRRRISSRNGTDDARRAQSSRLLMLQSCAGPPFGGYSCGVPQTVADASDRKHGIYPIFYPECQCHQRTKGSMP